MPAHLRNHSGGMLTDGQIDAIVHGIRGKWGKPDALRSADPPHPMRHWAPAMRSVAFAVNVVCTARRVMLRMAAEADGQQSSIVVDGSYLALVSDQSLRTTVIVGRPGNGRSRLAQRRAR